MRVDNDEIIPLLYGQELIGWNGESLFVLFVGLGDRALERFLISGILSAQLLSDALDLLASLVLYSNFLSDLSDFACDLIRHRDFLANPARYCAGRVRDLFYEDLVPPDILHHPGRSADDEFGPRLAVLCHERFVKNSHCRVSLLLDYQVMFLVRNH